MAIGLSGVSGACAHPHVDLIRTAGKSGGAPLQKSEARGSVHTKGMEQGQSIVNIHFATVNKKESFYLNVTIPDCSLWIIQEIWSGAIAK